MALQNLRSPQLGNCIVCFWWTQSLTYSSLYRHSKVYRIAATCAELVSKSGILLGNHPYLCFQPVLLISLHLINGLNRRSLVQSRQLSHSHRKQTHFWHSLGPALNCFGNPDTSYSQKSTTAD